MPQSITSTNSLINENPINVSTLQFEQMMDNLKAGIVVHNPDTSVALCNKEACTLLGLSMNQMLGKEAISSEWYFRDEYGMPLLLQDYPVNKVLATLKPLKDYVGAIERASNNDIVWVLVNAYPEFDDNVLKHVVVTFIDITKIKNSEKLLHEVTILAKAGGWELNLITNTLLLTDVAKKIHELPLDEQPTIAEAINFYKEGYSRNMATRILEDAREKGISFDYELQIVTSKGNECWVRIIGKPEFVQQKCVKLCGVIQDIHEKKLAEIALEKTKQEYKALFDENPDAVFSLDLEGNIIAANKGTADLVETTPEELMANHFGKYSDPEEIEKVKYHFEQVKKGIPQSFEANLITATGHKKVVSLINVPVIVNNEIIAISGISKDITARKEADIKLLQAKEMIEASLHELEHQKFALDQHAIVDIRDDNGKIIYVNDNFCAMSGYSREELIGNSYTLINSNYHPQSFFEEINKTIYSGQVWNGEICKKSKNGNLYWLRTTIVPFKNGSTLKPKQFISIRSDITKEVEANKTIRESNERFEYVTKATFDAIWEWNLITNDFYRGQGFETLFGYNYKDDISLKMSWDEIHPDDKERVIASVQEACNGKDNLWRQEFRFLKSNGEYADVVDKAVIVRDENGKAQRIIGAMQDITKTKERAEQMRLLESVVTNSNDMIIITEVDPLNEPGPRIIYVNEAFTKITGYTNEEVIGKTPRILQGEKTDKTILHDLRQKMNKWEITEVEVINYKKNGEEFWNNFTVVPIANKQGWFTHWIAIERDITERKKGEFEKEQLIKELTKSNTELKQFSYITSHNLRAPLTNLLAILSLLETNKIEDPLTVQLIESLRISTFQLNDTLNELLKVVLIKENTNKQLNWLSLANAMQTVKLSINAVIHNAGAIVQQDFKDAPEVYFDKSYLDSILINLLTNAIKYAHPSRRAEIKFSSKKVLDGIEIVVADNGIGFNMEKVKDKIFGLYQRFHNHPDSKGFGLYLIHAQITSLGGTISVDSIENEGTTFTIFLKS